MTQHDRPRPERHALAHARALRAVAAVTLGALTLGAAGCAATVSQGALDAQPDAAGDPQPDVSTADARPDVSADAEVADAQTDAADASPDAQETCEGIADLAAHNACCARIGWDWNRGCAAWGPFVPPSMEG